MNCMFTLKNVGVFNVFCQTLEKTNSCKKLCLNSFKGILISYKNYL